MSPAELERRNPNLAGGDIGMGLTDLRQMIARPTLRWYRTPEARPLYLFGVHAGVGVHGMCGYHAATYSETSSAHEGSDTVAREAPREHGDRPRHAARTL
jgi:phytoene dehydrogenase-like protein